LLSTISPAFKRAIIWSPTVELPPTTPPCANPLDILAIVPITPRIVATTAAIAAKFYGNPIPAAEAVPSANA